MGRKKKEGKRKKQRENSEKTTIKRNRKRGRRGKIINLKTNYFFSKPYIVLESWTIFAKG